MGGKNRLRRLRKAVKSMKPASACGGGFIMNASTERDGTLLMVYFRSHIAHRGFLSFLDRKMVGTLESGEVFEFTGWDAVRLYHPGADSIEVWGPHGVSIELSIEDGVVRDVFGDADLQRVMKELGGQLVSVCPAKRRRNRRATD